MVAIHVIGDAFVDLFCYLQSSWPERGGDACLSSPVAPVAGGSGVNTATQLQALVLRQQPTPRVILQTVFNPNDPYGKILDAHLQKHGMSVVNCVHDEAGATGHCIVMVQGRERTFMTHRGCVDDFTADDLAIETLIDTDGPLHVHIAGYYNMTGFWHGRLQQQLERLRATRSHPTFCSLVTQHDATGDWDGGIDELLPLLDFLIMNELEAKRILERARSVPMDGAGLDAWMAIGNQLSPSTVFVVTREAKGAVAFCGGQQVAAIHPAEQVTVVDPTGAGDAFTAGFLYGLWSSDPIDGVWSTSLIQQALLWGCAVGTAAVTLRGASQPPPDSFITDLYKRQKEREAL